MRGRKFQEIGGINILEQPEIYQESGNSLRKSVRVMSSLPVCHRPSTTVLFSDWPSMFM